MTGPGDQGSPAGLSRRRLLRRAAAAGTAAWVAPVLVTSLASPAAASTIGPGCYRAEFTLASSCGVLTRITPTQGQGCSPGSAWNSATNYPDSITSSAVSSGGVCTYTFTLPAQSGCAFDQQSVARKDQANQCQPASSRTNGCRTLTFSGLSFVPDRFKLLISCGGVLCEGGVPCASSAQSLLDDTGATGGTSGNRPPWAPAPGSPPGRG